MLWPPVEQPPEQLRSVRADGQHDTGFDGLDRKKTPQYFAKCHFRCEHPQAVAYHPGRRRGGICGCLRSYRDVPRSSAILWLDPFGLWMMTWDGMTVFSACSRRDCSERDASHLQNAHWNNRAEFQNEAYQGVLVAVCRPRLVEISSLLCFLEKPFWSRRSRCSRLKPWD